MSKASFEKPARISIKSDDIGSEEQAEEYDEENLGDSEEIIDEVEEIIGEGEESENIYEEEEEGNYDNIEVGDDYEQIEEVEEEEEVKPPPISDIERLDAPRELLEPEEITVDVLKQISVRLGQIRLCWPKVETMKVVNFPNVILPDGFLVNTNKEKLLLLYCENFRQQYHTHFPNRKPLLFAADNVVGQRKMVCTTLRPTTLTHPNLSTWDEMASFLADYVIYDPLNPPTDLSTRLYSPQIVFMKKIGHSFEMSTALCSLLLGRNYNAFTIYGFATQEVTDRIMRRVPSPFEPKQETEVDTTKTLAESKYTLRPPRDLRSKFLLSLKEKEKAKARKEEERLAEIRRKEIEELEKPPPDELYGRRIHGWVLMMPGNGIEKPFFIESTTGMRHELDSPLYCSIQSVWNNTNYWVNLQDDSIGLGNLDYDLSNLEKWEHVLPGEPIDDRVHPSDLGLEDDEGAAELRIIMDEKHLDMPEPWSLKIHIPHQDVNARFPTGKKKTYYKRTIVDEFSPYVQVDGLVIKIQNFSDLEWTDLLSIEERYKHRNDKLSKRLVDVSSGLITEQFEPGREDNVKTHYFYKNDNKLESWRKLEFYYKGRFDCLEMLDHGTLYLIENYVGREDRFYYRRTDYAKRGEPPPGLLQGPRRIIMKITEKFKRNESKKASDDIEVREFDFVKRAMHFKFHYEKGKITASTRTFLKPPVMEMVGGVSYKPELTYGYQAEIGAPPPKNSTLYSLLEQQLKEETESSVKVRHVEEMISEFVRNRALETVHPKLDVSIFNREQNTHQRAAMLEKELYEKTKKEREIEDDLDYLKPYLVRYKCPEVLRRGMAQKVRDDCIREFKELLVKRANDLQKEFQDKMAWLKNRHQWYTLNVDTLQIEEEQEYFKDMNYGYFVLHCLEIRLIRHRDLSPSRYQALIQYLNMHPKLQILYSD